MASRMFCASALARRAVVVAPRPRLFKRYYAEAAPAATGAATKITLTIATPVLTVVKPTEVDSVILPGLSGEFEVRAPPPALPRPVLRSPDFRLDLA